MTKKEDVYFIRNEKIVNESLARTDKCYDEIRKIIEKWKIETDEEKSLALISMNTLFKKLTLDRATDKHLSLNPDDVLETDLCGEED